MSSSRGAFATEYVRHTRGWCCGISTLTYCPARKGSGAERPARSCTAMSGPRRSWRDHLGVPERRVGVAPRPRPASCAAIAVVGVPPGLVVLEGPAARRRCCAARPAARRRPSRSARGVDVVLAVVPAQPAQVLVEAAPGRRRLDGGDDRLQQPGALPVIATGNSSRRLGSAGTCGRRSGRPARPARSSTRVQLSLATRPACSCTPLRRRIDAQIHGRAAGRTCRRLTSPTACATIVADGRSVTYAPARSAPALRNRGAAGPRPLARAVGGLLGGVAHRRS